MYKEPISKQGTLINFDPQILERERNHWIKIPVKKSLSFSKNKYISAYIYEEIYLQRERINLPVKDLKRADAACCCCCFLFFSLWYQQINLRGWVAVISMINLEIINFVAEIWLLQRWDMQQQKKKKEENGRIPHFIISEKMMGLKIINKSWSPF